MVDEYSHENMLRCRRLYCLCPPEASRRRDTCAAKMSAEFADGGAVMALFSPIQKERRAVKIVRLNRYPGFACSA